MIPIQRLNHAVLFVRDLERSLAFYEGTFGFRVVAREPRANAAFLRASESDNHHDLGLFGVGERAERPAFGSIGLYHLAWQVPSIEDLAAARDMLALAGALRGQSDHGATKSLCGEDPDGHQFEIMWMLPRDQWSDYEHAAPVAPLDLDAELARHSSR